MLRFEVSAAGPGDAPPPIDVDDAVVVIGSAAGARIRLPARAAQPEHVRIEGGRWRALHAVDVVADAAAGDGGEIGDGVVLSIGGHRVRVAPAPVGAIATPPLRTESLARELVRNLLGDGGAPTLEVERGPVIGAKRQLAPPESALVIGRGDEATWVIFDGDLSRAHAEVRRGWDGVRVFDRGSRNGTRVDGAAVGEGGAPLVDGVVIEMGHVAMRFHDPAERHLRGDPSASTSLALADLFPSSGQSIVEPRPAVTAMPSPSRSTSPSPSPSPSPKASSLVFYAALVIAALASAALVYLLAS